jgi:hypothetical protein
LGLVESVSGSMHCTVGDNAVAIARILKLDTLIVVVVVVTVPCERLAATHLPGLLGKIKLTVGLFVVAWVTPGHEQAEEYLIATSAPLEDVQ